MPTQGLRKTLDRLRHALAPNELTDEQLLQRFIAHQAAFCAQIAYPSLILLHGRAHKIPWTSTAGRLEYAFSPSNSLKGVRRRSYNGMSCL